MAGENMINIVRGLAVDGIRPEYMCRKPPDNPEVGDSNDSGDETIHAQTETDQRVNNTFATIDSKNGGGNIYFTGRPPIVHKLDGLGRVMRFK
ncbi:hypothetical protein MP638_007005 [Amoeboaphelidium occidentale]|nr:hypothetical protein MP638_007005 [Amoeboaphelidium occidentale]